MLICVVFMNVLMSMIQRPIISSLRAPMADLMCYPYKPLLFLIGVKISFFSFNFKYKVLIYFLGHVLGQIMNILSPHNIIYA